MDGRLAGPDRYLLQSTDHPEPGHAVILAVLSVLRSFSAAADGTADRRRVEISASDWAEGMKEKIKKTK